MDNKQKPKTNAEMVAAWKKRNPDKDRAHQKKHREKVKVALALLKEMQSKK